MVLHRQQAQFDRAKWRRAILVPGWVLQILLMLSMIGVFSYRLSYTINKYEEDDAAGRIPAVELVWEITGIAFPFLGLVLTIFEIAKLVGETLTPWTMLFTHVLKITTTAASLAIDIVMYTKHNERHYSLVGLGMDAALILIVLVPAIYSIVTYHRLASLDDYHHPANAKSFGYADIEQQQQQQLATHRLSIGTLGANSLRRLSSGSMGNPNLASDNEPVPLSTVGRSPSYYNHERDTQFEKYMIDRAMSAEFSSGGFSASGHSPGSHSPPNRSASNATDVSSAPGIVVSSGNLSNARPLSDSMGRTPSWGSSHVLVAVPEGDEEVGDHTARAVIHGHSNVHRQSADREALLGSRSRAGSDGSDGPGSRLSAGRYRDSMGAPRGSFEELDLGDRKRKRDF
ncbi:hypothetical protein F5X68DRAFT_263962 [Plectosphaerella plurivora]|uniref:Uncharacterized protein n=1 Tax=Plectosphaerella plurivora TaxID=936078 RepID=A0A9P8V6E4_9PEZI|nr:hypothetical protein F5X68DRAFT_263962 [Plectosphaerella plurivora]